MVSCGSKKMGYVETKVLFDEFELAKKRHLELQNDQQHQKHIIDSLDLVFQGVLVKIPIDSVEAYRLKNVMAQAESKFSSDNQRKLGEFNVEIWGQLSGYLKEYSKEKELDYLFGQSTESSVLYVSESEDVTQEVILWVNQKYKGEI